MNPSDQKWQIFIGNVSAQTSDEKLRQVFSVSDFLRLFPPPQMCLHHECSTKQIKHHPPLQINTHTHKHNSPWATS